MLRTTKQQSTAIEGVLLEAIAHVDLSIITDDAAINPTLSSLLGVNGVAHNLQKNKIEHHLMK